MLLVAITYATTYFKPFFFESALSVNLTVMLVITTLFISVMNKLASTSYIKWIEFWLIYTQLFLFTGVVLLTVLELYRDDLGQEINHHGRHVQVSGGLKVQISNKRTIMRILKTIGLSKSANALSLSSCFTEQKVVPGMVILAMLIYWVFGLMFYYDIILTY